MGPMGWAEGLVYRVYTVLMLKDARRRFQQSPKIMYDLGSVVSNEASL